MARRKAKNLTYAEKEALVIQLEREQVERNENKFFHSFPEEGIYARKHYLKHLLFMSKGKEFKQRALISGNRIGKTYTVGFETVCHLTGLYPEWWTGKQFDTPIKAWAIGVTNESTIENIQETLLGVGRDWGTGLIPKALIVGEPTKRPGVPGAYKDVYVKHISGGTSILTIKSQQQGWETVQGAAVHVVWFDEEVKEYNMYSECLIRTATTDGIIILTFTPKCGLTAVVLRFLPNVVFPPNGVVSKTMYVQQITWHDAPPHLTEEQKEEITDGLLPYELDIVTKGIPGTGTGLIFPISEENIVCDPFTIPDHWPRAYSLDPGWHKTACTWLAIDPETNTHYYYDEYYVGGQQIATHVMAIKSRGEWMSGVMDYAGTNQDDGRRVMYEYQSLGLNVFPANKAVDAGILKIWKGMNTGKLKIFRTCEHLLAEIRMYHRDENGKIANTADHAIDTMRYHEMSGIYVAKVKEEIDPFKFNVYSNNNFNPNNITGY